MPPNPTKKIIAFFFLGAALGALGVAAGFFSSERTVPTPSSLQNETPDTSYPELSDRLIVLDQAAGGSVAVNAVKISPPGGWVVIHEINTDGDLGNALGALRVREDAVEVQVELLRATLPRRQYAAALYRDDGDDAFSLVGDSIYVDLASGTRVVSAFATLP